MNYKGFIYLLLCILCCACKSNYLIENQPKWSENNFINASKEDVNRLKVVSYNIEHAIKIDLAIKELETEDQLKNADIIFLQEMDEQAVIKIANALELNYIYYPVSHYKKHNRNFGNAIVSKFHLFQSKKIILPHQSLNGGKRAATLAQIKVNSINFLLVSLHLETIVLSRKKRLNQLNHILQFIEKLRADENVIIAGDFNSFFPRDLKLMTALLNEHGFYNSNSHPSWTSRAIFGLIKPKIDHIFIRNLKPQESGVCKTCNASDHKAIWSQITWK